MGVKATIVHVYELYKVQSECMVRNGNDRLLLFVSLALGVDFPEDRIQGNDVSLKYRTA